MLTGDQGETAHNIGISCGLIDPKLGHCLKIDCVESMKLDD